MNPISVLVVPDPEHYAHVLLIVRNGDIVRLLLPARTPGLCSNGSCADPRHPLLVYASIVVGRPTAWRLCHSRRSQRHFPTAYSALIGSDEAPRRDLNAPSSVSHPKRGGTPNVPRARSPDPGARRAGAYRLHCRWFSSAALTEMPTTAQPSRAHERTAHDPRLRTYETSDGAGSARTDRIADRVDVPKLSRARTRREASPILPIGEASGARLAALADDGRLKRGRASVRATPRSQDVLKSVWPAGPYDLTLLVFAEFAVALPAAFVAVTATRTGCPLSVRVSVYVDAVAPWMFVQPLDEQRCHW
jgi:hypothetical protein